MEVKSTNLIKRNIARAFGGAAKQYDDHASLQQSVCLQLFNMIQHLITPNTRLLDLGCGTGWANALFSTVKPKQIFSLDLSEKMLFKMAAGAEAVCSMARSAPLRCALLPQPASAPASALSNPICADMDRLPLKSHSIDLIFSSLCIQWSLNLGNTLQSIRRTLTDDGYFVFSTLTGTTLRELKSSWLQTKLPIQTNHFLSQDELLHHLSSNHFFVEQFKTSTIELQFDDVFSVIKSIKNIGANALMENRRSTVATKKAFSALAAAYEQYRNQQNRLPLTYEISYGICHAN